MQLQKGDCLKKFLRKIRRSGEDLSRQIRRTLKRSPAHRFVMALKDLLPKNIQIAPPFTVGPDGKILVSIDQLCILISIHMKQQGLSDQPEWKMGWSITPIIENDDGVLNRNDCFIGLELTPTLLGQENPWTL